MHGPAPPRPHQRFAHYPVAGKLAVRETAMTINYTEEQIIDILKARGMKRADKDLPGTIEWLDIMSVGVAKWDDDHKELIALIRALADTIRDKAPAAEINTVLLALQRYAAIHFASEEDAMDRLDYPDLETHRAQHNDFHDWMNDEREAFAEAPTEWPASEALAFLIDWLFSHILTQDKDYEAFFAERANDCTQLLDSYKGVGG